MRTRSLLSAKMVPTSRLYIQSLSNGEMLGGGVALMVTKVSTVVASRLSRLFAIDHVV